MARIRFTAPKIERFACDAGKQQAFIWDTEAPGLGLRVTAGGAKAYIFQGRTNGKTLRITIGDPKTWTLTDAQMEARRLQTLCDQGKDPRQVKAEQIAEQDFRRTAASAQAERERKLKSLLARTAWDSYLQAPHPKWSAIHHQDHLNASQLGGEPRKRGSKSTVAGPLASLLDRPLASIDSQTLLDWLEQEKTKRPTAALNAYRKFRAFIRWCTETKEYCDYVQPDCYSARKVTDSLPPKRAKEGDCLQREQLSTWFKQIRSIGNPVIATYLQALLLTGARREELAGLCWKDIDFQWNSITIKDKVDEFRIIPLTPYLSQLLNGLPRRNQYVFSSPAAKGGKLVEPRIAHRSALIAAGLPHVSLHGLRRSFGTLAEWIECPAGVVAQIMGHKPTAIAEKHYRRRPLDLLRQWHIRIEAWMLEQAGIEVASPVQSLRVVASVA
jgi:integrase